MYRNEKFVDKLARALDNEVLVVAEKDKPLTYVSRRGIVEIHYGTENGTVEWTKDMYDYVREDLSNGTELFDPTFCTKEKETGKRYWFACIVCPCTLYKDENLCFHVNGQKHQKRALEKLEQDQREDRQRNYQKSSSKSIKREYEDHRDSRRIGTARTTRSHLKEKLENTKFPFVGLEYIEEYLNPGNPNSDPQYQCLLDGCKKAWGNTDSKSKSKHKHGRNYLHIHHPELFANDSKNMQIDELFRHISHVFQDHKADNNGRPNLSLMKTVLNRDEYMAIKSRGLGWSEAKAKAMEPPKSEISHFQEPEPEEKSNMLSEALDSLQVQVELLLEKLEKFDPSLDIEELKNTINRCFSQMDTMMPIVKLQGGLDRIRYQQIEDRQENLQTNYNRILHTYDTAMSHERLAQGLQLHASNSGTVLVGDPFNDNNFNNYHEEEKEPEKKKPKFKMQSQEDNDDTGFSMAMSNVMSQNIPIPIPVPVPVPDSEEVIKKQFNEAVKGHVEQSISSVTTDIDMAFVQRISQKIIDKECQQHVKNNKPISELILNENMKQNIRKYVLAQWQHRKQTGQKS